MKRIFEINHELTEYQLVLVYKHQRLLILPKSLHNQS